MCDFACFALQECRKQDCIEAERLCFRGARADGGLVGGDDLDIVPLRDRFGSVLLQALLAPLHEVLDICRQLAPQAKFGEYAGYVFERRRVSDGWAGGDAVEGIAKDIREDQGDECPLRLLGEIATLDLAPVSY